MQATVFLKLDGAEAQAVQMTDLVLNAPSVVHLDISPEDVARYDRSGQDLVLVLKSGETVVIRNFFVKDGAERSELVFEDDTGAVWQVAYDDAFTNVHITEVSAVANPVWFPAWSKAAFGAGLLGVLGICLTMEEKEPKPSIAIIDNTSPATEGTPDRIVSTLDNQEAVAISGMWTPGGVVNQIVITDGAGNSVTVPEADITVNPDGSYTTTADLSGLQDGTLTVTGTFTNPDNGKILTAQTTILKDVINEVTIDPITIDEGLLSVVTGTAEPLINVTLTIGNNAPVVVKADANGVWSYTLPAPQGYLADLAISATTTDKAGNRADDSRDLGALWVTNDPTAPSASLVVSESGLPSGTTAGDITTPDAHIVSATLQLVKPGNPVTSITFDPKLAAGVDPAPVVFTPDMLGRASTTAPLVVDTAFGTITITSFDPVTGTMSYIYSLDDDIDHPAGAGILSEAVKITVLEVDGDTRLQTLTLHVQDDGVIGVAGPQAVVTEGDTVVASGNLLTGAEGADGPEVNKIFYTGSNGQPAEATMGTSNLVLKTQHGTLTVKPDGDWTYLPDTSVKNPVTPVHGTGDNASDNFSFTLKDSDGSVSPVVTQEIVIKDTTPAITGPATGAVSEAYLPGNVLPDSTKLVTSGTLAVTAGKDAHLVTLAGTLTDSAGTPITLTSNGETVMLDWGPAPAAGEPAHYTSVQRLYP